MKISLTLAFVFSTLFAGLFAQEDNNFWMFGLGNNIVDDSGPGLRDYVNPDDIWHAVPYPSRLSAGYYLANGFGLEAIGSVNHYNVGKTVDGQINLSEKDYWAIDGRVSYDLNGLFGRTGWFDPYISSGAGFTRVGEVGRPTFNAGAGFNIWFTDLLGLTLNTTGKWSLNQQGTNHVQHAAGVVLKFDHDARKNAVPESIGNAIPASAMTIAIEEENFNASEVYPSEMMAVEPSLPVKPLKTEEELRMEAIMSEFEQLQEINYAYNSSWLTKADGGKLDALEAFLKKYPEVSIEIQGHADSRGAETYNLWLSERRAKRITEHLINAGISSTRLSAIGYGESRLRNHCKDGIACTEEEHRINRTVVYILQFPSLKP